ncbi:MAG: metallophosphoesterase [Cyanobacteria bacterium]|nr:metallophosphoesterase [Cyanobacteriota bacterium]
MSIAPNPIHFAHSLPKKEDTYAAKAGNLAGVIDPEKPETNHQAHVLKPETTRQPVPPVASSKSNKPTWLKPVFTLCGKGLANGFNVLFMPLRKLSLFNVNKVQVNQYALALPHLPKSWEGAKVLQITDLHFYEFSNPKYHKHLQEKIKELQPDIIAFTGDLVHFGPKHLAMAQEFLGSLDANIMKVACLGNHDYHDDSDGQGVLKALEGGGFQVLVNQAQGIKRTSEAPPEETLYISGLDDLMEGKPNAEKAFSNIPPGSPHLCLAHNPELSKSISKLEKAPDLIMSGHTHAGQFITSNPRINHFMNKLREYLVNFKISFPEGWFTVGKSKLYVNRGVGSAWVAVHNAFLDFAMPPLRMKTPPELSVFKLVRGKAPETP